MKQLIFFLQLLIRINFVFFQVRTSVHLYREHLIKTVIQNLLNYCDRSSNKKTHLSNVNILFDSQSMIYPKVVPKTLTCLLFLCTKVNNLIVWQTLFSLSLFLFESSSFALVSLSLSASYIFSVVFCFIMWLKITSHSLSLLQNSVHKLILTINTTAE